MSGVVSQTFRRLVPHGKLEKCIAVLEEGLRAIKRTPYHKALGKSFLHQSSDLANVLIEFCQNAVAAKIKLAAVYLEMNGFTINPVEWHCHLFGYERAGDIWDLDWLSAWDAESDGAFVLDGMESLQKVYAQYFLKREKHLALELAEEIADHLVTSRFMELVAEAHKKAKRRFAGLRGLPVLATAHDWDTVHKTR